MSLQQNFAWRGLAAAAFAAVIAVAGPAVAGPDDLPGKVSATATVTTDYYFRGINQSTDGSPSPAVQGSLDYALPIMGDSLAFRAGVWGSSVEFGDANLEMDFTGGFTGMVGDLTWDAGFIYYYYPGTASSNNFDYWEVAGKLSYAIGPVTPVIGINYSPDYFAASGDGWYLWGGADLAVNKLIGIERTVTLYARIGHQWIEKNANFGTPDYLDFKIAGVVEFFGFNLELAYVNTDIDDSVCPNLCGGTVVFTVSRTF
ncbi:MAG: TorF family putative porin [Rhodospirillales bacterium]